MGLGVVVAGGIIAQASEIVAQVAPGPGSPAPSIGMAGLFVSLTGLLTAGLQWYKEHNAAKRQDEKITEQARQIADLQKEVIIAADKRHNLRNQFNQILIKLQNENDEYKFRVANLEGRLGITDSTHASAINTVAGSVKQIAEHLDPPVPVRIPHVDPLANTGEQPIFTPREHPEQLSGSDIQDTPKP